MLEPRELNVRRVLNVQKIEQLLTAISKAVKAARKRKEKKRKRVQHTIYNFAAKHLVRHIQANI